jgi:Na+-driven multidrug efflux pump
MNRGKHRKSSHGKHRKTPAYTGVLSKTKWSSFTKILTDLGDFINMALIAPSGTMAISGVAATAIIYFFFVSIDKNGIKMVTGKYIGQSTSEKLANLPACLEKVKEDAGKGHGVVLDKAKEEARNNPGMVLIQHITYNSLYSSLILGLLVGGLAIAFPTEILELGGAEHAVAVQGAPYFQVIIGCVVFSSIASSLTSTLNSLKKTESVTIAASCLLLTHLTLGIVAVKVCDLGLRGVACANVVAIAVQVVALVIMLRRHPVFSNRVVKLRLDWSFQWHTCKEAWPLIFDKLTFQACIALFWHILQSHGADLMASQRIANQITLVPLALFTGLYPVIGAYVSNYYGDEDYKEIRRFTRTTLLVGTLSSIVVLMGAYLIGPWVTTLFFTDDKSLVEMTQMWLLFLVFAHGFNQTHQILTHSLRQVKSKQIISTSALVVNGSWGVTLLFWGKEMDLIWVSSLQIVATLMKIILLGWYFYTDRWVPKPFKPGLLVCLRMGWCFYSQRWRRMTPKQKPFRVVEYLLIEK